jgi:hypothetical protein
MMDCHTTYFDEDKDTAGVFQKGAISSNFKQMDWITIY